MRIRDSFPVAPYPVDPQLAGFTDRHRALIYPRSPAMPDPNERMSLNVREYMMNIEYRRHFCVFPVLIMWGLRHCARVHCASRCSPSF